MRDGPSADTGLAHRPTGQSSRADRDSLIAASGDPIAASSPRDDIVLALANASDTDSILQAAIASDAHGDATIALGHGDSITLPGLTAHELAAVLNSAIHLH
jgi:hypothetical protein